MITLTTYLPTDQIMKKLILLSLVLLISICLNAQEFEVTPDGMKDKINTENDYLVIEAPNKSAQELYQNALKYIHQTYKNPEEVLKGQIENEYLKFETHAPQFLMVKNSGVKLLVSANYTTELRFKDGKVKYDLPVLEMTADNGGYPVTFQGSIWNGYPIYKKNGQLIREDAKTTIENYFNTQVSMLSDVFLDKNTEDEW